MDTLHHRGGGVLDGDSTESHQGVKVASANRGRISDRNMALIFNHVAVFIFGFTAILGKLISYGSLFLVWHRVVIATMLFLCIPQVWRDLAATSWRQMAIYSGIGVTLCLHWVVFYMSVKLGDSVSITLTCMGTMAMFASVLEPMIIGVPFSLKDLLISIMVVCGIVQVYFSLPTKPSNGDVEIDYEGAIFWGLVGPFLMALVSVLNKLYINQGTALSIATIEVGAAAVFLTICVPLLHGEETVWYPGLDFSQMSWDTVRSGPFDLVWVTLLAGLGTNVCQYLGNRALNHISAFTANLIGILEPIYGIILGAVLFHENEDLSVDFYYGAGIILFALLANTVFAGIGNPATNTKPVGAVIGGVEVAPHLTTAALAPAPPTSSPNGSSKYVSSLRKPRVPPYPVGTVGAELRRTSRVFSGDDTFDEENIIGVTRQLYQPNHGEGIPV